MDRQGESGPDRTGGWDTRFEREALPHLDAVYHFARGLARSAVRAEDLVQDTYLQAFSKFDTYEAGTNCKAWLFRICKNLYIDRFRAERRRPPHQEFGPVEPLRHDTDRGTRELERRGIDDESIFLDLFGDEVNRFLQELPDEFRRALLLCDLEGLTYQEIANVLDVPIGTVRSRISRGRSILREKLEDYADDLGFGVAPTNELEMDDE
ncbi:MAG: sigma-70 family RNA polymerase sigma factor [Planctomycetes bacterium]|nr:sigma-70 family RNA polymerase sigma factor [Planctomycetota bacterium]